MRGGAMEERTGIDSTVDDLGIPRDRRRGQVPAALISLLALNGLLFALAPASVLGRTSTCGSSSGSGSKYTAYSYSGPSCTADLAIRVSDSPDPVATGQTLSYGVRVRNLGPDSVHAVIHVPLPNSIKFLGARPLVCTHSGRILLCDTALLAAGSTSTLLIRVQPQQAGLLEVLFRTFSEESSNDPNEVNNVVNIKTTVTG
jgi:uncharacterized repeat protein (TIGR01451 family)